VNVLSSTKDVLSDSASALVPSWDVPSFSSRTEVPVSPRAIPDSTALIRLGRFVLSNETPSTQASHRALDTDAGAIPIALLDELWEELYNKTGQQWARVSSGSMRPLIRPGDRVLIERVQVGRVRFGDVVLFKSEGQRTVHRIVGSVRRPDGLALLEKGDLNAAIGEVPTEQVMGRVSRVQGRGRTVHLVSGRGRILQVALAICSAAPALARRGARRVIKKPPRFLRRWSAWFGRIAVAISRWMIEILTE
jgi:signal peptidase I